MVEEEGNWRIVGLTYTLETMSIKRILLALAALAWMPIAGAQMSSDGDYDYPTSAEVEPQ